MSQFPALFLLSPCPLFSSLLRVLFDNDKNISYSRGSLSRPNSTLFIPGFLRSRSRAKIDETAHCRLEKTDFREGRSLSWNLLLYISLSLFLRIFPQLPSCSGRAVRPSSSSHEGSQKSPDNVEAIYQSSLPDKFYFFTVNLVRGHIASLMEKK